MHLRNLLLKFNLKKVGTIIFVVTFLLSTLTAITAQSVTTLSMSSNRFKINGQDKFLVLAAYFDGMDSPNINTDLDFLKSKGIDGIRLFPNWQDWDGETFTRTNRTLIDVNGNIRQAQLTKLNQIITAANSRNMIVDVTFARETVPGPCETQPDLRGNTLDVMCEEEYKRGVVAALNAIKTSTNIFIDLQNEASGENPVTRLEPEHITDLVNRIRAAGITLPLSVSYGVGISSLSASNQFGTNIVNFHSPFGNNLSTYIASMAGSSRSPKPTYLGEPYHTNFIDDEGATTNDLISRAVEAKKAGLSAWTFHFSGSFSLNSRLVENSLKTVERNFLNTYRNLLDRTTWGGGDVPPRPRVISTITPTSGPRGTEVIIRGTDLTGTIQFQDPNGVTGGVAINVNSTNTQASFVIPPQALDGGYRLAIGTSLSDISNVVAFTVTPGAPPTLTRRIESVTPNSIGRGGTVTLRGSNLSPIVFGFDSSGASAVLTGTINSSNSEVAIVIPSTTPSGNYTLKSGPSLSDLSNGVSLSVTNEVLPPPPPPGPPGPPPPPPGPPPPPPTGTRQISSITPTSGFRLSEVVIRGTNLDPKIHFQAPDGSRSTLTGNMHFSRTQVSFLVPGNAPFGEYRLKVGPNLSDSTNEVTFTVQSGTSTLNRRINTINPDRGPRGTNLTLGGENLSPIIQTYDPAGTNVQIVGNVNAAATEVVVPIPLTAQTQTYRIKSGPTATDLSNEVTFIVTAPTPPPPPVPLPPPPSAGQRPPGLVCVPPPEDIVLLAECNFWDTVDPLPKPPLPPGTPTNPIPVPGSGTYGVAAAYNSADNTILTAAFNSTGSGSGQRFNIVGSLLDAITLQARVAQISIVGPNQLFVGAPKAVFNSRDNSFLVAWEDERNGASRRHNYGRIFNGDGTPKTSDFAINSSADAFLNNLAYDPTNNKFIVGLEIGGHAAIVQVSGDGTVGSRVDVVNHPGKFEGHIHVDVNSDKNEYWLTYAHTVSGGDTAAEDDRIMLARLNASNMEKIGSPIQISQTRIGRNAFSYPQIAYNKDAKAAMVMWMERGRNGEAAGIYGRSITNDLELGAEFPVLTPTTEPTSDFFGRPGLTYNPWTQTFFVTCEDNNGGTMLAEVDIGGFVYNTRQILAPPTVANNFWQNLVHKFIPLVNAAAFGNYNPTHVSTSSGVTAFSARNLSQVVAANYASANAVGSNPTPQTTNPPPTGPTTNSSAIGQVIVKVYQWALALSALLAIMMMVLGGYQVMTAGGDASQATSGKGYIMSSVVGVCLLISSYLILSTINPALVRFDLNLTGLNQTTTPPPPPPGPRGP